MLTSLDYRKILLLLNRVTLQAAEAAEFVALLNNVRIAEALTKQREEAPPTAGPMIAEAHIPLDPAVDTPPTE